MNWLMNRLSEPSTYAGIAAVAGTVDTMAQAGVHGGLAGAVIALLGGVAAIVAKEKGSMDKSSVSK